MNNDLDLAVLGKILAIIIFGGTIIYIIAKHIEHIQTQTQIDLCQLICDDKIQMFQPSDRVDSMICVCDTTKCP